MSSSSYADALTTAMDMLAQDPRTVFLGQSVAFAGTSMTGTLKNVPAARKIEMPVCEDMQLGMSIGLALQGHIPVSLFPRFNFLLLATNMLVNHLDKLPLMGAGHPKVLIRVGVGADKPLHPGPQHLGDYTLPFKAMCQTVTFVKLRHRDEVVPEYRDAMAREGSTVLVELSELYGK